MREVVLLGDLGSRATADRFAEAQSALRNAGVRILECHVVSGHGALPKAVRRFIRRGVRIIVVAGGDGAMTSAVGEFAHRRAAMGVMPLGTGNSFAQSLGVPLDVEGAARVIAYGEIREVDLGVVNGKHFANFATVGLSSIIAENTPRLLKRILGGAAYVLAGLIPALESRGFSAKVRAGKKTFRGRVNQIIVASGRYYGNKPLLPDASLLSGRLSVFTNTERGVPGIAKEFTALSSGGQTQLPDAHIWSAKRVRIKAKPRQLVAVDGEAAGKTPVDLGIDPAALRVIVPIEFDGYP